MPKPIVTVMREARLRKRMTQEGLAAFLGIKQPSVSNWERGLVPIPPIRAEQLGQLFGIDPAHLGEDAYEHTFGCPR